MSTRISRLPRWMHQLYAANVALLLAAVPTVRSAWSALRNVTVSTKP